MEAPKVALARKVTQVGGRNDYYNHIFRRAIRHFGGLRDERGPITAYSKNMLLVDRHQVAGVLPNLRCVQGPMQVLEKLLFALVHS
jgi:hypothetical protein